MPRVRTLLTGLALLAVGATTACGEEPFQDRDPKGFEACSQWSGYTSSGDVTSIVGGGLAVAEVARQSNTPEIRDSVSNLFDDDSLTDAGIEQMGLLDREAFETACEEEGFEFTKAE